MSYREELIQVAAVAVAMVEDLDYGRADSSRRPTTIPADWVTPTQTRIVLDEVDRERVDQDTKWGPQHHDPFTWLAILTEEVGEAAQAALHDKFGETP